MAFNTAPTKLIQPESPYAKSLQTQFYSALLSSSSVAGAEVVREIRLRRWGDLCVPPAWPRRLRQRAAGVMCGLAAAPPSTRWAVLRTWLNGWCTRHRFQQEGACLFCGMYSDSLEHISRCHVVRAVGNKKLNLGIAPADPLSWMILDGVHRSSRLLVLHAAFIHAVYRAHNQLRHKPCRPPCDRHVEVEIRGLWLQHGSIANAWTRSMF